MKRRLTPRTLQDLRDVCDYIKERNPWAALRVRDAIETSIRLVADYPKAGRMMERGIRRFAMPRYPYLIFYGVDEGADEVQIFAIRHTARKEED